MTNPAPTAAAGPGLARRLGAFDATMIVMGGIIGAGIFANPANVVRRVGSGELALLAWAIGGALALIGSFVYAELAQRRPGSGGQYAYLRDAYHPLVAFLYGWTLLLVVQTGGMAGAAMIFARYARALGGIAVPEHVLAVGTLLILTAINCIGVRSGSNVQSALMLLKLAAIAALIVVGLAFAPRGATGTVVGDVGAHGGVRGMLSGLVPIMFAYGGWQTASFVSGEMKDPRRDLPRGLLIGVVGVIVVYLLVNIVDLKVLGAAALGASTAPAADVMRLALGEPGARLISLGIAVSTVGFLSQSVLTAPRVYHQMASDGLFFRAIAYVHPVTRVPVGAILLQGVWASVIALTGQYDRILNYVVSIDVLFFGLTAAALFVFRARDRGAPARGLRVPLHPLSTGLFVITCWAIALSTAIDSREARLGVAILAAGVPVYLGWARLRPPGRLRPD